MGKRSDDPLSRLAGGSLDAGPVVYQLRTISGGSAACLRPICFSETLRRTAIAKSVWRSPQAASLVASAIIRTRQIAVVLQDQSADKSLEAGASATAGTPVSARVGSPPRVVQSKRKKPATLYKETGSDIAMVAGVGFEPTTFRL